MNKLEGYKTLIVATIAFVSAIAGSQGYLIDLEEQAAISTGIMAVIMVGMRLLTKTPVLK